jgi:hypothetical protein
VAEKPPLVRWDELIASAIGSALAALILSRVGIAGTIIGAALTPVIITLTGASLARPLDRVRSRDRFSLKRVRGRALVRALVTAAAAFAIVAVCITIGEALAGKPVSRWGRHGGSGYTFGESGGYAQPARPPATNPEPEPPERRGPPRTSTAPSRPAPGRKTPGNQQTEPSAPAPPTTPTTPPNTSTSP